MIKRLASNDLEKENIDVSHLIGSKIIGIDISGGGQLLTTLQIVTDKGVIRLDLEFNQEAHENWNEIEVINYDTHD